MLIRLAFQQTGFSVQLHHARNGVEGMAFLRKQGDYADTPTPDLVLLDLNMPRKDGREVLTAIAVDKQLRHLPVVVLTRSAAQRDIFWFVSASRQFLHRQADRHPAAPAHDPCAVRIPVHRGGVAQRCVAGEFRLNGFILRAR